MSARPRFGLLVLACGSLLLGVATSFAQQVQQPIVIDNVSRNAGGSCIYGPSGELLHKPKGAICPEREQPPAAAVSSAPPNKPLPATLREEARALAAERPAVDREMARLREAVLYEDREAALRVTEEALARIRTHMAREQRFLAKVEAQSKP